MKIINKKNSKLNPGFTVVELLVALFVATAFLTTGYQLFSIIIQDGGESSTKAVVSSVAYNYLQDYKSFTTIPCTVLSPITDSPTTISGASSATVSVTISCPYINAPAISKILITIKYGNPIQTVGVATYYTPPPPTLADTDPANWIAIGTQVWARYNLNVGTRIAGTVPQTNNGGANIEKYCYGDTEAGCTATDTNGIPYGALYQWGEAMGYAPTPTKPDEFVQGICPAGSHIPSDAEWKTLEMFLGMTQPQADTTGWRGTNQGTQLQPGGSSGMDVPLAGFRGTSGSFYILSSTAYLWSSSESGGNAWHRYLTSGNATVYRYAVFKAYGFSVRCLGN